MKGSLKLSFVILPLVFAVASFNAFAQTQVEKSKRIDSSNSSSMARAIDTSVFDKKIAYFLETLQTSDKKSKLKKKLAQVYADRGFALTDAAQYQSALGDFRRCLKLNPKNKKAKQKQDQIISIYKAVGRVPPKEGEEPAPLPFDKQS